MKALVICTGGGVGDVLLATPCMRALRQRYANVVALTAPAHRSVLLNNPDVRDVMVDDAPFFALSARIARERFDAAVVTWATLRSAALPFVAGIPVRVGQARRTYSWLFTKRVTVRSELGDRTTHWTQILLDYARALECDTEDTSPLFVVDDAARTSTRRLLRGACIDGDYAVLHPTRGIAAEGRRWPAPALAALGAALRESFGVRLVVTGTASDRAITETIAAGAGGVSLAGSTTIAQVGALAECARFVVAMDSGPMHVAAAVGAPTVGIFALRSDEPSRWRPLGPRVALVRGTYPCPSWHRKETCPDFACIRELPVRAVIEAVRRVLQGSGERVQVAEPAHDAARGRRDSGAYR
jgi:ADP-heptose:LPS heptosyltransferase